MSDDYLTIDWIGGVCPVQSEGRIANEHFYFRARGNKWAFHVAERPGKILDDDLFCITREYGDEPYAAGWMPVEEARAFILEAAALYMAQRTDAQ